MTKLPMSISMIVAERDSEWSAWADALRACCAEVVVVQQRRGESPADFALRVRGRVAEEQGAGRSFHEAVLVGGGRTDSEAMSARSLVIRALVSPMVGEGAGRLSLGGQGSDRFSMLALASHTAEMLRGTGVSVAPPGAPAALAA